MAIEILAFGRRYSYLHRNGFPAIISAGKQQMKNPSATTAWPLAGTGGEIAQMGETW